MLSRSLSYSEIMKQTIMNDEQNIIICVGRQLGSGGHDVAKMLAEEFGCKFYDREVLNLAARESGLSEEFFVNADERKGFFGSVFGVHFHMPFAVDNAFPNSALSQENLFKLQSDAIRKAASESSCVFVGRCADYVLRDSRRMVSIFITADMAERVAQISRRHGCTHDEAVRIIEQMEGKRSAYYNYYTDKVWGHSSSYDLCLNSSCLGVEGTLRIASQFIRMKLGL